MTVASCLVVLAEAEASPLGRNANHQTPTMATTIRTGHDDDRLDQAPDTHRPTFAGPTKSHLRAMYA